MTTDVYLESTPEAIWGTIKVNNNLIVAEAPTRPELYHQLKVLAYELEGVDIDYFHVVDKLD